MPADILGSYGFFLFALFVITSGLSFLETGTNTFIAVLGDPGTSEQEFLESSIWTGRGRCSVSGPGGSGPRLPEKFLYVPDVPTIYALGIKGLGANTKQGGAFTIMASIGGVAAPPAMGLLYGIWHSMAIAMIAPVICYGVITHYAYYGSGVRVARTESTAVSEPVMPWRMAHNGVGPTITASIRSLKNANVLADRAHHETQYAGPGIRGKIPLAECHSGRQADLKKRSWTHRSSV